MQTNIEFARELIKGRIAEIVFEQMFRDKKEFLVLPSGYEHTLPALAQYRHLSPIIGKVIDNFSNAPDFVLINSDKDNPSVYLVEVKYRSKYDAKDLVNIATKIAAEWDYAILFVASPLGFFFGKCKDIINNLGKIDKLSESWISEERQVEWQNLLVEFERPH